MHTSRLRSIRRRAPSVGRAAIEAHLADRTGPFTITDVIEALGGTTMTVSKVVGDLVATGRLRKLGPDPQHTGRGRAPILYERA